MKGYCLDTSGISTPLERNPEESYVSLWESVKTTITNGRFAVTKEIYGELEHLRGSVGECLRANEPELLLEVGQANWDWKSYTSHAVRMLRDHERFVSEYNKRLRDTIGINDVTIVALAKTINLPVISMESERDPGPNKLKIPHLCQIEGVEHLTFNAFLKREGITS
jgi:hypothetical protein